ncbi:hypothetical protein RE6C_02149 [Rhodopirellula europaea 6C]|uniref:Uncharacterized protein n=1 Tax=Rhodopirellula europaea 6C TaxID=1263867 RepID=M2B5V7_9BACT|nr:hypothetical protein RE6C_02149 [Rhodopirellula europaea 6C]
MYVAPQFLPQDTSVAASSRTTSLFTALNARRSPKYRPEERKWGKKPEIHAS